MIVFDSPDLAMLQQAIDRGALPTMSRLLREGAYVALDDLQELVTPCSWPTLVRGSNVAEHGLLCDRQLVPGTYRIAPVSAAQARLPPFWRHISDAGLRSTVSSAYGAPLLPGFRGTQLVGWGTHDPFTTKLAGPCSDPPGLIRALERQFGRRPLRYGQRLPRTRLDYRRYIDECLRGVEQHTRALIQLLDGTDWDFFFASFSDGHQAGHLLWHLAHPGDVDHDAGADPGLRAGLMTIYREVDAGMGALLERMPEETAFFVTTPYGLGPNHHLEGALRDILAAGGWLVPAASRGAASGSRRLRTLRLGRAVAHRTVPARLRPALGSLVGRERLVDELMLDGIDWERTAAFPLPGDGSAFLRVNLAGREPRGTIAPGGAYDSLCAEIGAALEGLRDAHTGEPVTARVARFDELFGRPAQGPFPDLCIQWRRQSRVGAVRSERLGTVVVAGDSPLQSVQTAPGFLLGRAPGLPASGSRRLRGGVRPACRRRRHGPGVAWRRASAGDLREADSRARAARRSVRNRSGWARRPVACRGQGCAPVAQTARAHRDAIPYRAADQDTEHVKQRPRRPRPLSPGRPQPGARVARLAQAVVQDGHHEVVVRPDAPRLLGWQRLDSRAQAAQHLRDGHERLAGRQRLRAAIDQHLHERLDPISIGEADPQVPVLTTALGGVESTHGLQRRAPQEHGRRREARIRQQRARQIARGRTDATDDARTSP